MSSYLLATGAGATADSEAGESASFASVGAVTDVKSSFGDE